MTSSAAWVCLRSRASCRRTAQRDSGITRRPLVGRHGTGAGDLRQPDLALDLRQRSEASQRCGGGGKHAESCVGRPSPQRPIMSLMSGWSSRFDPVFQAVCSPALPRARGAEMVADGVRAPSAAAIASRDETDQIRCPRPSPERGQAVQRIGSGDCVPIGNWPGGLGCGGANAGRFGKPLVVGRAGCAGAA